MSDTITVTGTVATELREITTAGDLKITSFRLASTARRRDRDTGRWVDGATNWYTVNVYRQLAVNAVGSLRKGERVVVYGRLRVKEWETAEKRGINVEIDADSLGHDLLWGTTSFSRTISSGAVGSDHDDRGSSGPDDDPDAELMRAEPASGGLDGWAASGPAEPRTDTVETPF